MLVVTGWLQFPPEQMDDIRVGVNEVVQRSRADLGCVEYWWAEDLERPGAFRFFECWESEEHFDAHRTQPYEEEFTRRYLSRMTGAEANRYEVSDRRSAMG